MNYTLFLNALEQIRDADNQSGCYRSDAVRALAQDDLSAMLRNKATQTDVKNGMPAKNRVEELQQLLQSGAKPDFSNSDAHCHAQSFDVKYANSVDRCNLFLIQKQLMSLNTQAIRVNLAAKLAGVDLENGDFSTIAEPTDASLAREMDAFKKLSMNIAGLLTFDLSRQAWSDALQKNIQLVSTSARDILATLSASEHVTSSKSENAQTSTGIRHGN